MLAPHNASGWCGRLRKVTGSGTKAPAVAIRTHLANASASAIIAIG